MAKIKYDSDYVAEAFKANGGEKVFITSDGNVFSAKHESDCKNHCISSRAEYETLTKGEFMVDSLDSNLTKAERASKKEAGDDTDFWKEKSQPQMLKLAKELGVKVESAKKEDLIIAIEAFYAETKILERKPAPVKTVSTDGDYSPVVGHKTAKEND